nr:putative integron gene cassette protein [uncultured bacterium]
MAALFYIGLIVFIIGGIGSLIASFKVSVLWGLACFIPLVQLIFLVLHWDVAKNPFFLQLAGVVLMILGSSYQ